MLKKDTINLWKIFEKQTKNLWKIVCFLVFTLLHLKLLKADLSTAQT